MKWKVFLVIFSCLCEEFFQHLPSGIIYQLLNGLSMLIHQFFDAYFCSPPFLSLSSLNEIISLRDQIFDKLAEGDMKRTFSAISFQFRCQS